ncbi:MAG TPA: clostripain-related cysteine peptidase [Rectinemataceae bacterium]|nr:clostripain-related cysteine peptidase [Rectinemataceae bacterium]
MRAFRKFSSLAFLAFALVAGLSAAPRTEWTLLVYMAANNDLEPDALDNLNELVASESPKATIAVQVDRGMNYSSEGAAGVEAWSGAKRFVVEKGVLSEKADLGDIDSTDPKELASFVQWGLKEHPARHYALVLWDHGGGWTGYASSDANPDGNLDPASIRRALSSAMRSAGLTRLDLLGFDACLMANYEAALVFQPLASYLVASEETEPGHGWDYASFKPVFDSGGDGAALGRALLAGFRQKSKAAGDESEITLSLVDLGAMSGLEASVSSFSQAAVGSIAEVAPLLGRTANKVLRFGKSPQPDQDLHLVDLGAFATRVASEDPALKPAADSLRAALAKATLAEVAGSANKGATGLSAYFPDRKSSYDPGYDAIAPASWKKLITSYFSGGAAISKAQADTGGFGFAEAASVEKGPDGWTVSAPLLEGSAKTAIEYDLTFGRREGAKVIFMGSQSAEVSDDGASVSGLWDGKRFVVSQDGLEAEAYAEFGSEDGGSSYLDIPFAYYASGRTKGAYQYLLLEIGFDDKGEVSKEKWLLESPNQTYGEFKPKKGSRVQPIVEVFVDGKDGSTFEPTTKASLDPTRDIGWDWRDWNKAERVYFQLEVYDTGEGFDTAEAEMDLAK